LKNTRGVPVRFGLGNTSPKINKVRKSSDLIGVTPILITPEMVGKTIGVFTGIEVKKQNWLYTGTEREVAQLNFSNHVKSFGGIAGFSASVDDYKKLIERFITHVES